MGYDVHTDVEGKGQIRSRRGWSGPHKIGTLLAIFYAHSDRSFLPYLHRFPGLLDELVRRQVSQHRVDPVLVVVRKRLCQNNLGILESGKVVRPDVLLFEGLVEGLDMSVLLGRVVPDILAPYPKRLHALLEFAARILGAVVASDQQVSCLVCRD